MATLPLTQRGTCFSKHRQHQNKPFINLNKILEMGEQATNTLSGLLKTFSFHPTENSPYSTSHSNSLTMVDPYARRAKTLASFSDWEEMKEETLTRYFLSHQAPHSVFLNRNRIATPRKCLEICVGHYWHPVGRARNVKHPEMTGPQNKWTVPPKVTNTLINN